MRETLFSSSLHNKYFAIQYTSVVVFIIYSGYMRPGAYFISGIFGWALIRHGRLFPKPQHPPSSKVPTLLYLIFWRNMALSKGILDGFNCRKHKSCKLRCSKGSQQTSPNPIFDIRCIFKAANILRKSILNFRKVRHLQKIYLFSTAEVVPPELYSFIKWVCTGSKREIYQLGEHCRFSLEKDITSCISNIMYITKMVIKTLHANGMTMSNNRALLIETALANSVINSLHSIPSGIDLFPFYKKIN